MENHRQVAVELIKRLPDYSKLLFNIYRDPQVGKKGKLRLSLGVVYLLSPLELVPGVVPILGQLDDLIAVLLGIRAALRVMPPEQAARHLQAANLKQQQIDDDLAVAQILFGEILRGTFRRSKRVLRRFSLGGGPPKK